MILSLNEHLERLSARVVDTKEKLERDLLQRRDQVTDLHGVEFTRNAAKDVPAVFFISISPDMTYLSRFEFKLLISEYTQFSPTEEPVVVPVDKSGFRVKVDGVDVSAYLAAQYDGWISGEGVYPSLNVEDAYDLLEASSDMRADGYEALAERIVSPGYKRIEVSGTSLFTATIQVTCKFGSTNR